MSELNHRRNELAFAEAALLVGCGTANAAGVCALAASGAIAIDLKTPLGPDTQVSLIELVKQPVAETSVLRASELAAG